MKFRAIYVCLSLSICPVFAQTSVDEFLAEGLKQVEANKSSISQEDQKALIAATAALLSKHMTFRADGTSSAYCTSGERVSVEWKKFVMRDIRAQSVTEADKLNGISKKYSVIFSCDAHRAWDHKTKRWGEWVAQGYSNFPLGVLFQLKNGVWNAESPPLIKYFSPGPGPSISDSKPKPAGKTNQLPPGMQKTK